MERSICFGMQTASGIEGVEVLDVSIQPGSRAYTSCTFLLCFTQYCPNFCTQLLYCHNKKSYPDVPFNAPTHFSFSPVTGAR